MDRCQKYIDANVPEDLAHNIADMEFLGSSCDIVKVANDNSLSVETVGKIYFEVGYLLHLDWIRSQIIACSKDSHWNKMAGKTLLDDTYNQQMRLTDHIIKSYITNNPSKDDQVISCSDWLQDNSKDLELFENFVSKIKSYDQIDLNVLIVCAKRTELIGSRVSA